MFLPNISSSRSSKKGFTLIELMVVMTVIAILATMVLFGLSNAQASARDSSRQQIMAGIQAALERYYGDNQAYPAAATSGGYFCSMLTLLTNKGYLQSKPVDPQSKGDLCAGGGNDGSAGGSYWTYSNSDYNPTFGSVTYTTTCTGSGSGTDQNYQLWLKKESGGANFFCNPN